MEVTYTVPEPWVLWTIAAWFASGVVGMVLMVIADYRAKHRWAWSLTSARIGY